MMTMLGTMSADGPVAVLVPHFLGGKMANGSEDINPSPRVFVEKALAFSLSAQPKEENHHYYF